MVGRLPYCCMGLKQGMSVCVSVKALYEIGTGLFCTKAVKQAVQGEDSVYYDLYNLNGQLCCMDGEEVVVNFVGPRTVEFKNDNGEEPVYFVLTRGEISHAVG